MTNLTRVIVYLLAFHLSFVFTKPLYFLSFNISEWKYWFHCYSYCLLPLRFETKLWEWEVNYHAITGYYKAPRSGCLRRIILVSQFWPFQFQPFYRPRSWCDACRKQDQLPRILWSGRSWQRCPWNERFSPVIPWLWWWNYCKFFFSTCPFLIELVIVFLKKKHTKPRAIWTCVYEIHYWLFCASSRFWSPNE